MSDLSHRTRLSLLAKLREPDNRQVWDQAWQRFFEEYSPLMLAWCRRWDLPDDDAEDVTADVLLKLSKRLRSFEYDPTHKFRSWLKTVIANEVRDHFTRKARRPADYAGHGGEDALDAVADHRGAADDLYRQILAKRAKLARALEEVHPRVEPHTWEAFRRTALEGEEPVAVASQLGMTVVAVYKAKSRVLELIRRAVAQSSEPSTLSL